MLATNKASKETPAPAARTLVFVEVRFRKSILFGRPEATIRMTKQRRLCRAARHFLGSTTAYTQAAARFDVLAISQPNYLPKFNWIQDAFECTEG